MTPLSPFGEYLPLPLSYPWTIQGDYYPLLSFIFYFLELLLTYMYHNPIYRKQKDSYNLWSVFYLPLTVFSPSHVLTLNNPWWCTTPSWSFSRLSREYSVWSNILPCLPSWLSLLGFSRVRIYKTQSNLKAIYSITSSSSWLSQLHIIQFM